jgi:hypothetical protein
MITTNAKHIARLIGIITKENSMIKLDMELKDTVAKPGTKGTGDAFSLLFKRKREEEIIIDEEHIDLLATFTHLWNKDVKLTIQRKAPLEGAFNDVLTFVGRVTNTNSKILAKIPMQEFDVVGTYDVEFASDVENYRWKELNVLIEELQPEMNREED